MRAVMRISSRSLALIRDHGIVLPSDLAMLFKALITLEGLGRQLNPEFQLVEHIVSDRVLLRREVVYRIQNELPARHPSRDVPFSVP